MWGYAFKDSNDSESSVSWSAILGNIHIEKKSKDYYTLDKTCNTIQFSFTGKSWFKEFINEDYENWIASSDDFFYIYYQTSKDNYSSIHKLKVEFDVIYDRKPRVYNLFLQDLGLKSIKNDGWFAGALYYNYEGCYWIKEAYSLIGGDKWDRKNLLDSDGCRYYELYSVEFTDPSEICYHDALVFEWKDGSFDRINYTYTWVYDTDKDIQGFKNVSFE